MKKINIFICGSSGSGLLSSGEIIIRSLKNSGYYVHAERDYPSLIKGGHSSFRISVSSEPTRSTGRNCDILVALDKPGLMHYIDKLKPKGILIHGNERLSNIKQIEEIIAKADISLQYLPCRTKSFELGGSEVMTNMILMGMLWKTLNLELTILEEQVSIKFKNKPKLLEIDLKCVDEGFNNNSIKTYEFTLEKSDEVKNNIVIDGNTSIALGSIHGGVRGYYAYPMSPSSSILSYIAKTADKTKILVKQAEDEITAAQMALGSMHMGTRALVATSGGGYDLMTETVSLAGMIETPLVVIIVQRPGPATGLPTWTAQTDLNMAIHSSHGEFTRAVIACSDPHTCFDLIQHALNISEKFQIPVILLSEKTVAESLETITPFDENKIKIERGIIEDKTELDNLTPVDRYKFTEDGLSKRWLPGSSKTIYFANGDEHKEDGVLTEEAEDCKKMIDKRIRKSKALKNYLPEPEIFGDTKADISFIGWGSSKNIMLDIIEGYKEKGININYLHYDYVWPLKTDKLKEFIGNNGNINIIEGNHTGQLADLLEKEMAMKFNKRLLKYDGRPFFTEDVEEYIENINE